ncbi:MAG: PEP-CTERM sorting domain-containing protein [Caldimonas sp.]
MKIRLLAFAALTALTTSALAAPIDWNTWTSSTAGSISTSGGPIAVTFAGPPVNLVAGYPSYTPGSTFADGTIVDNAPLPSNNILQLVGGSTALNTVTFASAVVDPVMAIWSLGQGGINAQFAFTNATPVFVSGGPSAEYGGPAITVVGNTVFGSEGNGTVQFLGTYTSISWTNPVYENWYGFDVGIAGVANPVPEPETYALMLAGLGGLGFVARRRRRA